VGEMPIVCERPAASRRDAARFSALVQRHYARVYDYLCWLTRDPTIAEDLTQETFARVWQSPPDWRRRNASRAWVMKVALNEFRQHARQRGVEVDSATGSDLPTEPALSPPAVAERAELGQIVRVAVLSLPFHLREVVVLSKLEGLTLREVAEMLEIPLGTVKSRLAKAFTLLREALREWEEEDR